MITNSFLVLIRLQLSLSVAILLGCNMLSIAQNSQITDSKVSWNVKAGMKGRINSKI